MYRLIGPDGCAILRIIISILFWNNKTSKISFKAWCWWVRRRNIDIFFLGVHGGVERLKMVVKAFAATWNQNKLEKFLVILAGTEAHMVRCWHSQSRMNFIFSESFSIRVCVCAAMVDSDILGLGGTGNYGYGRLYVNSKQFRKRMGTENVGQWANIVLIVFSPPTQSERSQICFLAHVCVLIHGQHSKWAKLIVHFIFSWKLNASDAF